jgi:hypothetical protein
MTWRQRDTRRQNKKQVRQAQNRRRKAKEQAQEATLNPKTHHANKAVPYPGQATHNEATQETTTRFLKSSSRTLERTELCSIQPKKKKRRGGKRGGEKPKDQKKQDRI